jgi:sugar (pentulose or hexulose) kinase
LEFGHNLERIRELGFQPQHVHVAGDWSRRPVWRQLVANVLGLPVAAVKGGDGAALGAALQAAVTFFSENGEDLSYQEIAAYAAEPAEGSRCEPDESEFEYYQESLARRQFLAESLRDSALT